MLDAWGIGVLSQSLARVSNTRFYFIFACTDRPLPLLMAALLTF
jgi:hypothetical protein